MIEWLAAAVANDAALEAARAGARVAGHFSPLNTAILSIAIGLLGIILKNQIDNRKLTIGANGEIRKEFIEEMENLRVEIRSLRRENDQLRDEVRSLHGVIDGMRREGLAGQISAQRVVADMMPRSPEIDRAMRTLGDIQGDVKP